MEAHRLRTGSLSERRKCKVRRVLDNRSLMMGRKDRTESSGVRIEFMTDREAIIVNSLNVPKWAMYVNNQKVV